jgi:hypothetical protein
MVITVRALEPLGARQSAEQWFQFDMEPKETWTLSQMTVDCTG